MGEWGYYARTLPALYQWHHRVDDLEALNLIENNKITMTQVEIISIFLG
jgi:hypothetical protein